jgi:epidermal growth factor receptor substrate 15
MKKIIFYSLLLLFSGYALSQTDDQKRQEFSKKVKDGDMLFAKGKYLEAKKAYESAATINPSDENVKKQIQICDANEQKKSGFEADKEYNKLVSKADEKFKSGDYQAAKDLFTRATKIKTSDTYPPKMLKQIEDLLNPKTVAKAEPLADLGQTSEMSIEEAQKALKAADIARKNEQNTGVISKTDMLTKNENELASNRIKEMEAAGVSFSEVKKRIDSLNQENINEKDTVNIKLQHEDNSVTSVTNFQQTYQRDLLGFVDRTLVNKTKINDSITLKNKQIGSNNDTLLFNRVVQNEQNAIQESDKVKSNQANTEQSITNAVTRDEKRLSENVVVKEEVIELVKETYENIQDLEGKLNDKNIKNTNETVEKHLDFSEKADDRTVEKSKVNGVNNEKLESQNKKNVMLEDSLLLSPEKRRNNLSDSLNKRYYNHDTKFSDYKDSNRIEVMSQVKASVAVVQSEIDGIESNQTSKRQEHEIEIVKLENKKLNFEDSVSKVVNTSAKELNVLVKKQENQAEDSHDLDAKDINTSATKLTNLETETNLYASQGVTKPSDAQSSIENLNSKIENSKDLDVEKRTVKVLETKGIIENIEKKGIVFDDKAANSIGTLYPDGVTQEQFNKTDDKGSLLAVVTRRIVVKNGYGQIYTRTQTKDFITYSKNGAASTETVWQRETQDAKLKKN